MRFHQTKRAADNSSLQRPNRHPGGIAHANRHYKNLENLIGFFVNTLVLRADLSGQPSFKELLQRVRTVVLEASRHQDLPFDQLVEALQPARDPGRQPSFQVMFSLQLETPLQDLDLPRLSATLLPVDSGAAQFDLSLELTEEIEGLTAAIAAIELSIKPFYRSRDWANFAKG